MTTCAQILPCGTITPCGSTLFCDEVQKPFAQHKHKENPMDKALSIAKKVCAVALGVLAAYTAPWLFVPSFAFGAIVGVFTHKVPVHNSHHHKGGGCSHGFIEDAAEVKLPETLSLIANAAVMAVHIDHHDNVFVPIVGLTLGIWAGNLAAPALNHCCRKVSVFISNSFLFESKNLVSAQ
ncbi:MAG TPA: hypothetical protein VGP47_07175 [Parachlamydiaceae bacterium]|nr:hypothetical protein [Parachlamydiaceae bacterium]